MIKRSKTTNKQTKRSTLCNYGVVVIVIVIVIVIVTVATPELSYCGTLTLCCTALGPIQCKKNLKAEGNLEDVGVNGRTL
jgi:hypothetical protein